VGAVEFASHMRSSSFQNRLAFNFQNFLTPPCMSPAELPPAAAAEQQRTYFTFNFAAIETRSKFFFSLLV
jgi:hypothetical protein